ncbi:MAG: 1,2-phenylacetyl-CoA epoxidase subunit PaaD [Bacteroidia bacterium]
MIDIAEKNTAAIWEAIATVMDPEIPVLSVVDLGIITEVKLLDDSRVEVFMTPTFSGCPAIKLMEKQVREAVEALGYTQVSVETNFDVSWSSNRISEKGREIIKNFGLAPPPKYTNEPDMELLAHTACPYCNSTNTTLKTPFGPTLCRSMHYCYDCLQAFEQFKPI